MVAVARDSLSETLIVHLMWHFAAIYSATSKPTGFGEVPVIYREDIKHSESHGDGPLTPTSSDGMVTLFRRSK